MRLTCFLLLVFIAGSYSCSKKKDSDEPSVGAYRGIYVESTLRKDTIDFTRGWTEYVYRDFPANRIAGIFYLGFKWERTPGTEEKYEEVYTYLREGFKMKLSSTRSSTLTPSPVVFKWNQYDKSFTIGKFYNREGLPDVLVFEKID